MLSLFAGPLASSSRKALVTPGGSDLTSVMDRNANRLQLLDGMSAAGTSEELDDFLAKFVSESSQVCQRMLIHECMVRPVYMQVPSAVLLLCWVVWGVLSGPLHAVCYEISLKGSDCPADPDSSFVNVVVVQQIAMVHNIVSVFSA